MRKGEKNNKKIVWQLWLKIAKPSLNEEKENKDNDEDDNESDNIESLFQY